MRVIQVEVGCAMLHDHTGAPRHHPGAEEAVDAVDQRGGAALGIDRGDVDGVAGERVLFPSRRRHTSYWRDCSSDVCSSDLYVTHGTQGLCITRRAPKA